MKNKGLKYALIAIILAVTGIIGFNMYIPGDLEYKEAILREAQNPTYTLKNLEPVMGERELIAVIKRYNDKPLKYAADINEEGDGKGVENLTCRLSLHSHTSASDGLLTPEEALNLAATYADKVKKKHPFERYPFIMTISDHYTTEGCKQAIDLIQKNPEKYKNLKIVFGQETKSMTGKLPSEKQANKLHILLLGINPYDEDLNNINEFEDFRKTMRRVHALQYGIIGIAHPLRYFEGEDEYKVIPELFDVYASLKDEKILFAEGHYQPYKFKKSKELLDFTRAEAKKRNIYSTGGFDTHGHDIFKNVD